MKRRPKSGFLLVAAREWRWLLHDRVALVLIFGVPFFAFVVLAAVFSQPVIRGLGVVVVDADRSDTSRALVEQVAASPNLRIVARVGDLASATSAIRSGDAIAAVYIPANFERDVKAARRPQVVGFYNQQYLTAAGVASAGLTDSLSAAAASAAPAAHAAPQSVRIGSLVAETVVLANPQKTTRSSCYVALADDHSCGYRARWRVRGRLRVPAAQRAHVARLRRRQSGHRARRKARAAVCDLLPDHAGGAHWFSRDYWESALGAMCRWSLRQRLSSSSPTWRSLRCCSYWSATSRLGSASPGVVVSPAFGYAGVGFPTLGMNAFSYAWSAILPLRWYMEVLFGQGARGLPVSNSGPSVCRARGTHRALRAASALTAAHGRGTPGSPSGGRRCGAARRSARCRRRLRR